MHRVSLLFTHISRRTSKFQSAVSICQFLFPGMLLYAVYHAGRSSQQKSLDSPNSLRIRILRDFFKVKPVISWNGQNSFQRIFPRILRILLSTWGLFLVRFFFEKSRSNVWGIYESTPQILFEKDPQNSNSERVRKIEGFFLRANLIVRPASYITTRHSLMYKLHHQLLQ